MHQSIVGLAEATFNCSGSEFRLGTDHLCMCQRLLKSTHPPSSHHAHSGIQWEDHHKLTRRQNLAPRLAHSHRRHCSHERCESRKLTSMRTREGGLQLNLKDVRRRRIKVVAAALAKPLNEALLSIVSASQSLFCSTNTNDR